MLGHHRDVDEAWAAGRPKGCWNRDALRRPREGHTRPLGASLNPVAVSQRGTRARGPSQPPFAQVCLLGRLLGTNPGKARSVGARAAAVSCCVPRGAEGGRAPEPHCLHSSFFFLLSVYPSAVYFFSWWLSFLICYMGIIMVPLTQSL